MDESASPERTLTRAIAWPAGASPAIKTWRLVRRQPIGAISALVIIALIFIAIFAPLVANYDPLEIERGARLLSPSSRHFFGTDENGRDVFSRVVYGARVSLRVGILAVAVGVFTGAALGLIAGYYQGAIDMVSQRIMDIILAFPGLVLALALAAVLGPGEAKAMLAIGIVILPHANRVVRSSVLTVKGNLYIEAVQAIGASDKRIILFHILPNVFAPIIVLISIVMGYAILIEATLSFLGVGVRPPNPSWGQMLSGSGRQFLERAPWLAIFPGMAITLVVLAFNFLGDALRDILDPRLRGRV